MRLFWREHRLGQRLIVVDDSGHEEEVGGVRKTSRGFDAFAKVYGYDPDAAASGLPSMDEAKKFVEARRPWEMFEGTMGLQMEPTVQPLPAKPTS
ncbi:MAG: hypothetical protein EXR67_00825 [Dehalococcoidia bacterium]|nr:hypothetical protein [Dehalococcoidia bacterium]